MSEKVSRRGYVKYAAAGVVVVAGAAAGGYYYSTRRAAARRPIKFGFPAPLTGIIAADGEEMLRGARLAAEEINAEGGILGHPIEFVTGDTEAMEAGTVASVVEKLITRDKVDYMTTGYCSNTLNEIDICQAYKMPYVHAGLMQIFEKQVREKGVESYSYIFGAISSYDVYTYRYAQLLDEWEKKGLWKPINHKLALINSENDYSMYIGNGLKDTLLGMGWELVVDELVAFGTVSDWRPIISKIRENPPAVIINTDYNPPNEALFLEQFLENPTPSVIYMQYGPCLPEFLELTGKNSNGVTYTLSIGMVANEKNPVALDYKEKFKERWGTEAGPAYAAINYDLMYIWKQAMEKAGDPFDKEAVVKALEQTDYKGIMGRYVFNELHMGEAGPDRLPAITYQIWDGKYYLLDPENWADAPFKPPPYEEEAKKKLGF